MFVELIEHLRCPAAHEPTALVAAASRSEHRHILDGVLGCPACGAEYPVRDGVTRFGAAPGAAAERPSAEVAMRVAAFLDLTDAHGYAVLTGRWCAHAEILARLVETPLVLVNPPEGASITGAAAVLETAGSLPFADGTARGVALDDAAARPASGVAILRAGGRAVAPVALALPAGLREIARDERDWVAERIAPPASGLVELRRAR